MNAHKESLKKASRVHASSHKPTKKYAIKMKVEELEKQWKERVHKVCAEKLCHGYQRASGKQVLIQCRY